ncbi:Potassium transporter 5 [Dionaea muscipula]
MAERSGRDSSSAYGVQANQGGRKVALANRATCRMDSLNVEAGMFLRDQTPNSKVPWTKTMSLAFQSIGVVYGDIGTSPLYVYSSIFPNSTPSTEDILGVLSLIIYTIILLPMLKYVFIVLRANDNGDGGTFALYSKLCRHAKVSMIPNQQPEDRELSNYDQEIPSKNTKQATKVKEWLESSRIAQQFLFLLAILGTSMVIGDGVLTPPMSVLSAVAGIKLHHVDADVWISVVILIMLFMFQRFGTDKVGFTFAPIVSIWFLLITSIGLYNLFKYDIGVLRAFYPKYIIDYFRRNGKTAWISLGGVIQCITGTEAMFADLGHFNVRAIQISFSTMVAPAVLSAYIGQGAYLTKHPDQVSNTFYASLPGCMYWPTFVVAVGAAIVASQAMISGAYAIISQSLSLGCFPRVKVIHTSAKYEGQVYIPEVNYALMVACLVITIAFKTTVQIGNAYGIAVVFVMVITTTMLTLIMLVVWETSIWKIFLFIIAFGLIELLYLSSVLYKFKQGGWVPLTFAFVLMTIMAIWHYVYIQRYKYELENKVSVDSMKQLLKNPEINKVPGIGLLYSELVQGVPPIFPHLINNTVSMHSVLVFVSIKALPISKVALQERFVFRRVEPRDYRMYRCVVRYGYKNVNEEPAEFERQLVQHLVEYIQQERLMNDDQKTVGEHEAVGTQNSSLLAIDIVRGRRSAIHIEESLQQKSAPNVLSGTIVADNMEKKLQEPEEEETQYIQNAMRKGVVYLLGETQVIAKQDSSFVKKIVVDYAYDFLRRNFRQGEEVLAIPRRRLLRIGMTYEI